MAAYAILLRQKTLDPKELEVYAAKAPAANKGHPLTPLAVNGAYEVLEGAEIEGAVVLSFPSMADAKSWYRSPAYQAAATHRHAGAEYQVIFVEGVG